jgi:hypothetical protein
MGRRLYHYRPELHYMRGPGPKWHEKHAGLPAPVATERRWLPPSLWLISIATVALLSLAAVVALA